ncbi:MAG: hypothetical protein N2B60_09480 [Psychrobacter sp.]
MAIIRENEGIKKPVSRPSFEHQDKSLTKAINELSKRQSQVALHILFSQFNDLIPASTTDLGEILSKIKHSEKSEMVDEIIRVSKKGTVDDEYFEWLESDERSRLWFYAFFTNNSWIDRKHSIPYKEQFGCTYYESIILNIDFFHESNDHMLSPFPLHKNKKVGVKEIELYKNHKLNYIVSAKDIFASNRTNDKYFEWIDTKDSSQLIWAYKYLEKNKTLIEPKGFIADCTAKKLAQIKASIDVMGLYEASGNTSSMPPTRLLFINNMRRAWSQKKFREAGKTKTKYHLPLTKQSQKRLAKMAAVKGLSETAMLDILINSEYKLKFLNVDGKEIY